MNKTRYYILLAFTTLATSFSAGAQYISTFAGTTQGYSGDGGPANAAKFNACTGMTVDGAGNIFVADAHNHVVRKIDVTGMITTFAGTGTAGYSGNGGAATAAKLNNPMSVATDAAGNVYIADNVNNVIRVVNAAGKIQNYAGNAISGYSGDGDTAHLASLKLPQAIALDASGNLYIADGGNNVIRKVGADRIISTVAGNGALGDGGDGGQATDAKLSTPSGIAVNAAGDIYIADIFNNRVRKVDAVSGIITTIAGNGMTGNSGNGGPATAAYLNYPSSVSLDMLGNVYLTDAGNSNVRMINTSGIISNIAGSSTSGYAGDGDLAVNAKLSSPRSVFVDGWGRIYIVDMGNHVIRKLTNEPGSVNRVAGATGFSMYPNPAQDKVTVELNANANEVDVTVYDMVGRTTLSEHYSGTSSALTIGTASLPGGIYTMVVSANGAKYTQRLIVEK